MIDTDLRSAGERTRAHFGQIPVPTGTAATTPPTSRVGLGPKLVGAAALVLLIAAVAYIVGPIRNGTGDTGVADVGPSDEGASTDITAPTSTSTSVDDPRFTSTGMPVTIDPREGLRDGQTVTVRGESFPPGTEVYIGVCSRLAPGTGIERCDRTNFKVVNAGADGTFEATYTLRRILEIGGTAYDCTAAPAEGERTACILVAAPARSETENGQVPLWFDPDAPLAPRPELVLGRVDGIVDFEVVDVALNDPTGNSWSINQCATIDGGPVCIGPALVGSPTRTVQPVGGMATARIVVRRWIGGVDCMAEPGRCSVVAEGVDGTILGQQVSFAEGSVAPPVAMRLDSPKVQVGQTFAATVDGLVAGQVDLWMCTAGATTSQDCLPMGWFDQGVTSSTGSTVGISAQTDQIRTAAGPIESCGAPDKCEIVLFAPTGQRVAAAPIVVTP